MRYLSYVCSKKVELTLNHPKELILLSTWLVKVQNVSQCINLTNLYSYSNFYDSDDIFCLKNLRRVVSRNDGYSKGRKCFIHDLFLNSKVEYVHVWNDNGDTEVAGSIPDSGNI